MKSNNEEENQSDEEFDVVACATTIIKELNMSKEELSP